MVYATLQPCLGPKLWSCNLDPKDIHLALGTEVNQFWVDILHGWFSIKYQEDSENQYLWLNSLIRIENKPIFWKENYLRGLETVSQLYQDGRLKSFLQLYREFGLTIMQINGLLSAIPTRLKGEHILLRASIESQPNLRSIYKVLCTDTSLLAGKHKLWEKELIIEIQI